MKNNLLLLTLTIVFLSVSNTFSAEPDAALNDHLAFFKPWLGKWQRSWGEGDTKGTQTVTLQSVAGGNGVTIEMVLTIGKQVERSYGTAFWDNERHQIVSLDFNVSASGDSTTSSQYFQNGNEIIIQTHGKNTTLISKSILIDADTQSYDVQVSYDAGKPVPPEQMYKLKFKRVKD